MTQMSTDLLIQTTVVSSCSVQCSSLLPLPPCLSQSLIFPSLSDFRLVPSFQLPPIAGKSSSFGGDGGHGTQPTMHEPTSSADFTRYSFGIQSYPYFCESLCHSWSELQMKLTRNFYYSKNSEIIVRLPIAVTGKMGLPGEHRAAQL